MKMSKKRKIKASVESGYWFSTTHGVQPGSIPKGVAVLDIIDTPRKSFVKLDRFLSTSELNEFDMKEEIPPSDQLDAADTHYFANMSNCSAASKPDFGGAYDVEPDMIFTREEINEVCNDAADEAAKQSNTKVELSDCYMTDYRNLTAEYTIDDSIDSQINVSIDFRRIQKPSDLAKYTSIIVDNLLQDIQEYKQEYIQSSADLDDESSKWKLIRHKMVEDFDGFLTDYTLYENTADDSDSKYICMFGDRDLYLPDEGYADWSGDSLAEAEEWFDNYTTAYDDDDDILLSSNIQSAKKGDEVVDLETGEASVIEDDGASLKAVFSATLPLTNQERSELLEIAERYNTSVPVSGDWESELAHEQKAIADHFECSMKQAKLIMIEELGFDPEDFK